MSDPNFFLGKSEAELREVIAENLTLILGNHIYLDALERGKPYKVSADELVVNGHLLDRTGAIVNALCAMGKKWSAANWNRELLEHKHE